MHHTKLHTTLTLTLTLALTLTHILGWWNVKSLDEFLADYEQDLRILSSRVAMGGGVEEGCTQEGTRWSSEGAFAEQTVVVADRWVDTNAGSHQVKRMDAERRT